MTVGKAVGVCHRLPHVQRTWATRPCLSVGFSEWISTHKTSLCVPPLWAACGGFVTDPGGSGKRKSVSGATAFKQCGWAYRDVHALLKSSGTPCVRRFMRSDRRRA